MANIFLRFFFSRPRIFMHFIFSLHNACDVGVSQENLLAKKKSKENPAAAQGW